MTGVFSYVSNVVSFSTLVFFKSNTLVLSIRILTSLRLDIGVVLLFELLFLTYLLYFKEVRLKYYLLGSGELNAVLSEAASFFFFSSLTGVELEKPSSFTDKSFLSSTFSEDSSASLSSSF